MANKPDSDGLIIPRPSFTWENAKRFIEMFDSLIDNPGQDVWFDPAVLDIKASTFKHRMSEALLWLINFPAKNTTKLPKDYAQLRAVTRFKFAVKDGVLGVQVHFTYNLRKRIQPTDAQAYIEGEDSTRQKAWRDRVLEFLSDNTQEILILDGKSLGCILNSEDQEWLRKTFESADIVFEVGDRLIRAAK